MSGPSIGFSLKLLGRSSDHTIRAIMGFAWIIAIIIATSGIITGFAVAIFGLTEQVGYSNRFTIKPIDPDKKMPNNIIERLSHGDFREVMPIARKIANFSANGKILQTHLIGTNLTTLTRLFAEQAIIEGRPPYINQTPLECLKGIEVKGYLTTNITYHIHNEAQLGNCEVVGVISGVAELQQAIIVNLEDFATMIGETQTELSYNEVKLQTETVLTLSEMKKTLSNILNEDYEEILVWNEQQADIFTGTLIRDISGKLELLYFVLLIIALLRLFHSISWFAITNERTFLILRTIGLSKERLFLLVIILGQIVGSIGFVLGLIIGYSLPPIVISVISTIFGISFLVTEFPITNIAPLWLVSTIITTMATIWPSFKVIRTPPSKISMLIKEK